jgi:predicted  nucleic acid-binding Zn ribbon protein
LDKNKCELETNEDICPICNSDLRGEKIPEELQDKYGTGYFSRKIGISSLEHDRVIRWKCPDCGGEWER